EVDQLDVQLVVRERERPSRQHHHACEITVGEQPLQAAPAHQPRRTRQQCDHTAQPVSKAARRGKKEAYPPFPLARPGGRRGGQSMRTVVVTAALAIALGSASRANAQSQSPPVSSVGTTVP